MTLDELDRLAGIHVMGWELRMPSRVWIIRREKSLPAIDTGKQHNKGLYQNQWKPTRNISQAFECLEKSGFKDFSVYSIPRRSDEFRLNVRFACRITEENFFCDSGICDTASEAIVRACLKAKGVEV